MCKIISLYQSCHGSAMSLLLASGSAPRRAVNEPFASRFVHILPPTCWCCRFGKEYPSCELPCASLIGKLIELWDPSAVVAVMVGPAGHTGGIIGPPEKYQPQLREICDLHNVLLVFDEIPTGVGRTGIQGAVRSTDRERHRQPSTRVWAADAIRSAVGSLGAAVNDRRAVHQCNRDVAGSQHRRSTRRPKSAGRANTEHYARATALDSPKADVLSTWKTGRRASRFTRSGGLVGSTASRICQLSWAVRRLSECPLPASDW